jgi:hypothetical protein
MSGGDHPGTHRESGIDRLHQRDVSKAYRSNVPDRGEAGQKCLAGVSRAPERRIGRKLPNRAGDPVAGNVVRQVGVRVDQAGQEREIAQIDSAGPRRHAARSDAHDSAIGDDHHGGRDELAPGDVHHSGGTHHNRLLGARGEIRKEQKGDEGRHGAAGHRENVPRANPTSTSSPTDTCCSRLQSPPEDHIHTKTRKGENTNRANLKIVFVLSQFRAFVFAVDSTALKL